MEILNSLGFLQVAFFLNPADSFLLAKRAKEAETVSAFLKQDRCYSIASNDHLIIGGWGFLQLYLLLVHALMQLLDFWGRECKGYSEFL